MGERPESTVPRKKNCNKISLTLAVNTNIKASTYTKTKI